MVDGGSVVVVPESPGTVQPDDEPKKPHVSVSSLSKYRLCPRQWYYSYVEKRPRQKNDNLIIGSGLHAGCEYNYRQKITSGNDCPEDEVVQAAVEKVRAEAKDGFTSAKGYDLNALETITTSLSKAHTKRSLPMFNPPSSSTSSESTSVRTSR